MGLAERGRAARAQPAAVVDERTLFGLRLRVDAEAVEYVLGLARVFGGGSKVAAAGGEVARRWSAARQQYQATTER